MCKTCAEVHKLKTRHDRKTSEKVPGKKPSAEGQLSMKTGRENPRRLPEQHHAVSPTKPCSCNPLQALPSFLPLPMHKARRL